MLVTCAALVTFLVLDIAEVNPFIMDGPRVYTVQFKSEEQTISYGKYQRGTEISKPSDPTHSVDEEYSYTFVGWDLTGDGIADIVPTHAYYSFLANAVYSKKALPQGNKDVVEE